jgi:hypothetical protein
MVKPERTRQPKKEGLNMLTNGGKSVKAGTYWNMENGERVEMVMAGVLPGSRKAMYVKAPGAAILAAGPVLGLIFAVFLPLIGIVMTLAMIGRKLAEGLTNAAAGSLSFGWRPIEAYLAGRKQKKAGRGKKVDKGADR